MPNQSKLILFVRNLIEAVSPSQAAIRAEIDEYIKDHPDYDQDKLADKWANKIVRLYAGEGVVTALPGVIPGLGTAAQVAVEGGAITVDLVYMIRCMGGMTMGISYIYKKTIVRGGFNEEFLKVLGMWCGVLLPIREFAKKASVRVARVNIQKRLSAEVLKRINRKVGTTIVTKYGTKRGGIAIGRVIPFGVGAAIGGGFNYFVMKGFKKAAIAYFGDDGNEEYAMKT